MATHNKNSDISNVASCLSMVPHPIEDIAADCGISVKRANECLRHIGAMGVRLTNGNAISKNGYARSKAQIEHICKDWRA